MVLRAPVEVMLARAVREFPLGRNLAYEVKLDGWRATVQARDGGPALRSRRHRDLGRYAPEILTAATRLPAGVVLDGELIIPGRTGGVDFAALQTRLHSSHREVERQSREEPAAFVAFDILAGPGGEDLRSLPYDDRRAALAAVVAVAGAPFGLMPMTTDPAAARTWLLDNQPAGVEGVVAKRRDRSYSSGQRGWTKFRATTTHEAIVGGVIGTMAEPEALILGLPDRAGRLRVVGRTGPVPKAMRAALGDLLDEPVATSPHPWPPRLPASRFGLPGELVDYTPVSPELVVEVRADTAWESGRWRHPVGLERPRPDLLAVDVDPVGPSRPGSQVQAG